MQLFRAYYANISILKPFENQLWCVSGRSVVLVIEWRKLGDLIPIIDEAQDNTTNLRSPVDIIPAALCRPNTTDGMGKIHGSVAGIAVVTCQ